MMTQDPMNEPTTDQPQTSWGTSATPSGTADKPRGRHRRGTVAAVGLLAAGAIAGGVLAGTLTASAETTPTPSASSAPSASGSSDSAAGPDAATGQQGRSGAQRGSNGGADGQKVHGSAPVRDDEKALSTADAATVTAAALKAVPGGTVYRVETDAGDGEYEAHMTKADGTEVTVKLDADFAVTGVEDGMGTGDPAPKGGPGGGAPNGTAPNGTAPNGAPHGTASATPSTQG